MCQGEGTAENEIQGLVWAVRLPLEEGLLCVSGISSVGINKKKGTQLALVSLVRTYCQHLSHMCLCIACGFQRNCRPYRVRAYSVLLTSLHSLRQCLGQADAQGVFVE